MAEDQPQHLGQALAAFRKARHCSQEQVAIEIGTTQSGVARIERQDDFLVSTLYAYVAGTGARLRLVAMIPFEGDEVEVELLLIDGSDGAS